ncbi:hypothetical protein LIP_2732 [Limnochorda pilosa]|uniref:Uncharacterized protein n=1 Tax=Limnochorda pilosa TaxID=1555112 RepID=A0A0K2SNG7_LIMPI|nr:hypothetical protein LIP_2732 [Limnochorda pilosa]
MAPLFARVIEQGVREGVLKTRHSQEVAEWILTGTLPGRRFTGGPPTPR